MTKKNEKINKCLLVLTNEFFFFFFNWESYILLSTEKARDCKCVVGHTVVLFKWLLLHSVG